MPILEEAADQESLEIAEDLGLLAPPTEGASPRFHEPEYPDYDKTNSYIISGPLGNAKFHGVRYQNWREAKAATTNRFQGRVLQFWTLGHRWFARLRASESDPGTGTNSGESDPDPESTN